MAEVEERRGDDDGFDRGYEEHCRRQARLGLSLSPAERLAWLEAKNAEARRLLGRARKVRDGSGP
jgi:hypothetical protein